MASMSDDEDVPRLSADALDALKQFYGERDSRQKQFEDLKNQAESEFDNQKPLSMDVFAEDWNASQFWYSDETAATLAQQLLNGATNETCIAVVSAPSVFIQLKNLVSAKESHERPQMYLLEYDERFSVFKEFVYYDFEQPTRLPVELKGKFDRIILDPPFLSNDCQTKAALTVRYLSKNWVAPLEKSGDNTALRLIVCTGERMETLVNRLYSKVGLHTTTFDPKHSKGLSNEFRCYANFKCDVWEWR